MNEAAYRVGRCSAKVVGGVDWAYEASLSEMYCAKENMRSANGERKHAERRELVVRVSDFV